MKVILVILCVFTFTASAGFLQNLNLYDDTLFKKLSASDVRLDSTAISGSFNDYVDKTLASIRNQSATADSITLPTYNDSFVYKILYIFKTIVHLQLNGGKFSGFSNVQRYGNCLIHYNSTAKILTASVNLTVPELVFTYDLDVDWIFGSSKAQVTGFVRTAVGTVILSANATALNIALDIWNFPTPQVVNIQIKGGYFTVNYFTTEILKSLNNIFTEKIWVYSMNTVIKSKVEEYLDIISKSLFKG